MPLPLGLLLAGAGLVLLAASRWRRTAWLLAVSRLKALGWVASIGLEEGLKDAYAWSQEHLSTP